MGCALVAMAIVNVEVNVQTVCWYKTRVDSWLYVVVQLYQMSLRVLYYEIHVFFLCFDQQQEEVLWIFWGKTSVAYR